MICTCLHCMVYDVLLLEFNSELLTALFTTFAPRNEIMAALASRAYRFINVVI